MAVVIRLAAAVLPVVLLPAFVHSVNHFPGHLGIHGQLPGAHPQPVLIGGIDPDIEHIRPILQHRVGAATYDNAAFLLGQVPDNVGLGLKQLVLDA